jgi:hypothetical protein
MRAKQAPGHLREKRVEPGAVHWTLQFGRNDVDLRSLEFAPLYRQNPGTVLHPDKRTVVSGASFVELAGV